MLFRNITGKCEEICPKSHNFVSQENRVPKISSKSISLCKNIWNGLWNVFYKINIFYNIKSRYLQQPAQMHSFLKIPDLINLTYFTYATGPLNLKTNIYYFCKYLPPSMSPVTLGSMLLTSTHMINCSYQASIVLDLVYELRRARSLSDTNSSCLVK